MTFKLSRVRWTRYMRHRGLNAALAVLLCGPLGAPAAFALEPAQAQDSHLAKPLLAQLGVPATSGLDAAMLQGTLPILHQQFAGLGFDWAGWLANPSQRPVTMVLNVADLENLDALEMLYRYYVALAEAVGVPEERLELLRASERDLDLDPVAIIAEHIGLEQDTIAGFRFGGLTSTVRWELHVPGAYLPRRLGEDHVTLGQLEAAIKALGWDEGYAAVRAAFEGNPEAFLQGLAYVINQYEQGLPWDFVAGTLGSAVVGFDSTDRAGMGSALLRELGFAPEGEVTAEQAAAALLDTLSRETGIPHRRHWFAAVVGVSGQESRTAADSSSPVDPGIRGSAGQGLLEFVSNPGLATTIQDFAGRRGMGRETARNELNALWHLGILSRAPAAREPGQRGRTPDAYGLAPLMREVLNVSASFEVGLRELARSPAFAAWVRADDSDRRGEAQQALRELFVLTRGELEAGAATSSPAAAQQLARLAHALRIAEQVLDTGLLPETLRNPARLDAAVNEYNAEVGGVRRMLQEGRAADSETPYSIPTELTRADVADYLKAVADGKRILMVFAAGRATRMRMPTVFDWLGIGGLTGRILRLLPTEEDAPEEAFAEATAEVERAAAGVVESLEDLSIVQRQALQMRWQFEQLIAQHEVTEVTLDEVLNGARFTLVGNESNLEAMANQMVGIGFAGFRPEHLYFRIQEERGGLEVLPDGALRPFDTQLWPEGHGEPFVAMNTIAKGGYRLNEAGELVPLEQTLVDAWIEEGVERWVLGQVNDLHLIEDAALVERWTAASRARAELGVGMVMEMVENPILEGATSRQKGGATFVTPAGVQMRDTLAMKSPDLDQYAYPSSLSRMLYDGDIAALKDLQDGVLPAYLVVRKTRDGRSILARELVSGDASSQLGGATMEQAGYQLKTFKIRARMPAALEVFAAQDAQDGFRLMVDGLAGIVRAEAPASWSSFARRAADAAPIERPEASTNLPLDRLRDVFASGVLRAIPGWDGLDEAGRWDALVTALKLPAAQQAELSGDPDRVAVAAQLYVDRQLQQYLQYGDTPGSRELLNALSRLAASRGMQVPADEIQLLNGAQEGLAMAAKLFINAGDTVIVQQGGPARAGQVFERYGAVVESFDLATEAGLSALEEALASDRVRARLLYVSDPLLPSDRYARLLAIAERHDLVIVDDDSSTDQHEAKTPPLKAHDGAGRVVYLGSFSPSVRQGLRLGFMAAHRDIVRRAEIIKGPENIMTSGAAQMVGLSLALEWLDDAQAAGRVAPQVERVTGRETFRPVNLFSTFARNAKPSAIRQILKLMRPGLIYLAGGLPAVDLLPLQAFRAIFGADESGISADVASRLSATDDELEAFLNLGPPLGQQQLREVLAELMRERGMPVTPEQVGVIDGSQDGLSLLAKLLLDRGDYVIVQDPTYGGALATFATYGANFITADLDTEEGLDRLERDLEAARAEGKPVKLLYVMSNFSNPTGRTLPLASRGRLLALSDRFGFIIIEDDAYHALSYDPEPLPPTIKQLDLERGGDRVIHLESSSKEVFPHGIGTIAASQGVLQWLAAMKEAETLAPSGISQLIVYKFLSAGLLPAHLENVREYYRVRRDATLAAIDQFIDLPVARTEPAGGFFVEITLPKGYDAQAILPLVIDRGAAVMPAATFFALGGGENSIRVAYSNNTPDRLQEGIRLLSDALREAQQAFIAMDRLEARLRVTLDEAARAELLVGMRRVKQMLPADAKLEVGELVDLMQDTNVASADRRALEAEGLETPPTYVFEGSNLGARFADARILAVTVDPEFVAVNAVSSALESIEDILAKGGLRLYVAGEGNLKGLTLDDKLTGGVFLLENGSGKAEPGLMDEGTDLGTTMRWKNLIWSWQDGGKTNKVMEAGTDKEAAARRWVRSSASRLSVSGHGVLGYWYLAGPDVGTTDALMAAIVEEADRVQELLELPPVGGRGKVLATTSRGKEFGSFPHMEWMVTSIGVLEGILTALENPDYRRMIGLDDGGPITLAIQGFGDVGSGIVAYLAELLELADRGGLSAERDALVRRLRIISVSDIGGTIVNKQDGLDIPELLRIRAENMALRARGEEDVSVVTAYAADLEQRLGAEGQSGEVLYQGAQVLIPAAMPNVFTNAEQGERIEQAGTVMVAEAANISFTNGMDDVFAEWFAVFLGEILNGGGVHTSTREVEEVTQSGETDVAAHIDAWQATIQDSVRYVIRSFMRVLVQEYVESGGSRTPNAVARELLQHIEARRTELLADPVLRIEVRTDAQLLIERGLGTRMAMLKVATERARREILGGIGGESEIPPSEGPPAESPDHRGRQSGSEVGQALGEIDRLRTQVQEADTMADMDFLRIDEGALRSSQERHQRLEREWEDAMRALLGEAATRIPFNQWEAVLAALAEVNAGRPVTISDAQRLVVAAAQRWDADPHGPSIAEMLRDNSGGDPWETLEALAAVANRREDLAGELRRLRNEMAELTQPAGPPLSATGRTLEEVQRAIEGIEAQRLQLPSAEAIARAIDGVEAHLDVPSGSPAEDDVVYIGPEGGAADYEAASRQEVRVRVSTQAGSPDGTTPSTSAAVVDALQAVAGGEQGPGPSGAAREEGGVIDIPVVPIVTNFADVLKGHQERVRATLEAARRA